MIKLPWDKHTIPHCVIDITHQCNITCKACYRAKADIIKTVDQVIDDINVISRHQRVHTISLAGGEPTLHPELCRIVRHVKQRGFRASLVTNGVLLSDGLLDRLKDAGLDLVMVHVDEGQQRPDLSRNAPIEEINGLRRSLTDKVAAHGMDAGLCVTVYNESLKNLPSLIDCILTSKNINYLFATHAVEIPEVVKHAGCSGYQNAPTKNSHVLKIMKEHFGLDCFAYIPSRTSDGGELPCISYYIPVAHGNTKSDYLKLLPGKADLALIKLSKAVTGRYMYYTRQNPFLIGTQISLNGIAKLRIAEAAEFIFKATIRKSHLRAKRLVFENAPIINEKGNVNCCDFCPNSTVRNGQVIPVCLADHNI